MPTMDEPNQSSPPQKSELVNEFANLTRLERKRLKEELKDLEAKEDELNKEIYERKLKTNHLQQEEQAKEQQIASIENAVMEIMEACQKNESYEKLVIIITLKQSMLNLRNDTFNPKNTEEDQGGNEDE